MKRYLIMLFACLAVLFADAKSDASQNLGSVGTGISNVSIIKGATKKQADEAYEKEDYQKAAQLYESLMAEKGVSSELYYNLGNCYYKLDNIAGAVLNYERAYMLDPGDADIRANLALARGKTVDKVTPPSELFFVTWARNVMNMTSVDSWAVIGICAFALLICGILVYAFMSRILWRKVGFYSSLVMLFVVVVANVSAYNQQKSIDECSSAVVIAQSVTAKSSPSDSSTDLFLMHEGTKVEISDKTMRGWYEVVLEEGKVGWVPAESVEII